MRAFERGNDAFEAREAEKRFDRFFVADLRGLFASRFVPVGMFRSDGRIVQAARRGVDRRGIAVRVLEHERVEAVHHAFRSEGERAGVVAELGASAERFHAVDFHRVVREPVEKSRGVRAAAHAGADVVRKLARHFDELFPRLDADDALELAHHQRERMRPDDRADAVNRVHGIGEIRFERRVHRFLQRSRAARDGDDFRAEHLHAHHVRVFFPDVRLAHVDFHGNAEVGARRRQRDAVLPRARFRDELFLAEVFREQRFAHAVVEFVRARVVQVFALEVNAPAADFFRQVLAVVNRRRPALEMLADAAQFPDEVVRAADRVICARDFVHLLLQRFGNEGAAEFSEKALGVGKTLVCGKLFVVHM